MPEKLIRGTSSQHLTAEHYAVARVLRGSRAGRIGLALFLLIFLIALPAGADEETRAMLPTHDSLVTMSAMSVQMVATLKPTPAWVATVVNHRPSLLPALYVSLAGLQTYDAYSTLTSLNNGDSVETNPVFRGVMGHPAALISLKSAVTVGSIYITERLWRRQHRTAAIALMATMNGMMAIVAAHNASVLQSPR